MLTSYPRARRSDLVVQTVDTEVLVYDTTDDNANLLNRTAALVWQECDGKSSVPQIAARVSRQLGAPVDEKVVWYTLDQLSGKNLLEERVAAPANVRGLTRREFIRAGLVGAAVVLPVIVTMTAPSPAAAGSPVGPCCVCTNGNTASAGNCAVCKMFCEDNQQSAVQSCACEG